MRVTLKLAGSQGFARLTTQPYHLTEPSHSLLHSYIGLSVSFSLRFWMSAFHCDTASLTVTLSARDRRTVGSHPFLTILLRLLVTCIMCYGWPVTVHMLIMR